MSRFNLLLIATESSERPAVVRTLGKVFPSNFVFEVKSLQEAGDLLRKLHIDMMIVDLDKEKIDFLAMDRIFPNMMLVGLSNHPRTMDVPMNVYKHRMFNKSDLMPSLLAELRTLKKSPELPEDRARKQKQAAPAVNKEFLDFSALVSVR